MRYSALPLLVSCLLVLPAAPSAAQDNAGYNADFEAWIAQVEGLLPLRATELTAETPAELAKAADAVDGWAARITWSIARADATATHESLRRLSDGRQRIDGLLEELLAQRADLAPLGATDGGRETVRAYLRSTARLTDLSGRLRYALFDALGAAAFKFASQPAQRERLVDALLAERSAVGAEVMAAALFDPPRDAPNRAVAATPAVKEKLLRLIAVSGARELLPVVARFAAAEGTPPELVLSAAETIRAVGLPQDARPGQDETLPPPTITAAQLHETLTKLPARRLRGESARRRTELLAWLSERRTVGLVEDSYRLGKFDVRPGDWLLMRNPSPYNLFTDLSPGLFTHVGVVAMEQGSDGLRRMVVVDLPERERTMQATNVEVYVERTLNYVFLRPKQTDLGRVMGQVAASVIGNPTEFDLNFRTELVAELKGRPLAGQAIKTYCAGLLLLCGQETGLPRSELFPLPEGVAGGRTAENLATMGMSVGTDFISPTGALFAPALNIVGRREPVYDPRREIEEAVYDHFAVTLAAEPLRLSTDLSQSLRVKLAEAARDNPALARSLAEAAGINSDADLAGAARAAAVIETLDEIAYGASDDFVAARAALTAGSVKPLRDAGATDEQIAVLQRLRERHDDLFQKLSAGQLAPRDLRIALVRYYTAQGRRQLDQRFFGR